MPKQYELGTIPFWRNEIMDAEYEFLPELFLRAPYYSFARYDMDRLPEVIDDQVFRNAIWLASPGFYRQLERKNFDFNSLLEKEKNTLYKYYNRMCFRPTPFGSFASFTNLAWGSGATVHLENDEGVLLHLLPDRELISRLNALRNDQTRDILLTKNPTLYRFGGEFRFIKSSPDHQGRYHFTVDAFKAELFYQKIISLFKERYYSIHQVQEWILNYLKCTPEEAQEYLTFLLDEQILFGPSVAKVIYRQNESISWFNIPVLDDLLQKARCNPIRRFGLLSSLTEKIAEHLPIGKDVSDQLFYAALERPYQSGGPGLDDQVDLKLGIKALQLLSIPGKSGALQQFIAQFSAKFDLEKVPLLMALDPDAGINYNNLMTGVIKNDVLKEIRFPAERNIQPSHEWTEIHRLLFKIWRKADRDHYGPLNLRESDLTELEKTDRKLIPPTIAIMFRKTENELLIEHAGGVTATSLIGRFSMFSDQTLELAWQIANAEQVGNEGIVFADISQLTDRHVDNINQRKMIYPYEIPINVNSSLDYHAQIRPDDLYLSVYNGELILESKRLNKRVIPRLATAYNFNHNELAIFRLLCDLQYQVLNTNFSLNLEVFFPDMDFYPRVCIGHVILTCARWRFRAAELQILFDENEPDHLKRIREFRIRYQLPQRISIGHTDQQLIFDLGNREEATFFIKSIGGLKKIDILEYLLPDRSVKTGNRAMAGQYIAFMKHRNHVYAIPPKTGFKKLHKTTRNFQLGSDWLYLKIHCTPESADLILLHTFQPFLLKNRKHIRKWFFIRYNENGDHLRIRLNTRIENIGYLLASFKKCLNARGHNRLVKELQGDTYRRELERYGSDLIHLVEQYFDASSNFVLNFLNKKDHISLSAFDVAFFISYHLIDSFLDNSKSIKTFTDNMTGLFLAEFNADRGLKVDIDAKYRAMKSHLAGLLENSIADVLQGDLYSSFMNLMRETKIIALAKANKSVEQRSKLIGDLVHMHLNRAFQTDQRPQELLIYYCLNKYMSSKIARLKKDTYSG